MKRHQGRLWRWCVLIAMTGTVLQIGGVGFTRTGFGGNCQGLNFYQNGLLTSVDFCYLLDCQNGFLGGAVQPCGDPNVVGDELLIDCGTPLVFTTDTQNDTQNQGQ